MGHIFIGPYDNHFLMDFNFFSFNMHIKKFLKMASLHMEVFNLLITM
jgi:hypothetical protein